MKMKYSEIIHLYFGYYKDILYAISSSKEAIKTYFELHRNLDSDQYEIEEEDKLESDLILNYEDMLLTRWRYYFIPNIDVTMLELYEHTIDTRIEQIIQDLKDFAIIAMNVKKVANEDVEKMIDSIKVLQKFKETPKIMNKMAELNTIDNSILFMDMEDYISHLRAFNDMKLSKNRWNMY